jgi:hypothetical protein
MPDILDTQLKRALSERIRFYNELGIYDFYRRGPAIANISALEETPLATAPEIQPEQRDLMTPRSKAAVAIPMPEENIMEAAKPKAESC